MSGRLPPQRRVAFLLADRRKAAFTFVEVMIGACLTAVLLAATLGGVVALQKSYSATEGYGAGLADQMRLLDYLAQDLRRAIAPSATAEPWVLDADGQGVKITVPDYYRFNSTDKRHLFPIANDAILDSTTGQAYYSSGTSKAATSSTVPYQTIAYRYDATRGVITRTDPWQPRVSNGASGYKDAAPTVIATSMDAFPNIAKDATLDSNGGVVRYTISFYSTFQPLAARGGSNTGTISLHSTTFIRSKNLLR